MALADDKRNKPPRMPPPIAGRERGGWLAKIAPGVHKLVAKRDTPENLWVKCPDTGEVIYRPDLEAALWVTPAGRHMRVGPQLRFAYTFDDGRFRMLTAPKTPDDPLNFTYSKPYKESLISARKATGDQGSMGAAAGEQFVQAAEEAVKLSAPLVVFTATGGMRMQEGMLSLMQMARATVAIQQVRA